MSTRIQAITFFCCTFSLAATTLGQPQQENDSKMKTVTIKWFGHAFFLISNGVKIAIDPFQNLEGYPNPDVAADIVLVTHEHFDHNKTEVIKGNPQVVRGQGKKNAKGVEFVGVKTFHDANNGKERGQNTIFVFEMSGIRLAHCGDLGHLLRVDQVKEIGRVDVLMIPVGGFYTIDARAAWQNVERIKPKIVIPMHYKQPSMGDGLPIAGVDGFLQGKKNVTRLGKNVLTLKKDNLPQETSIYVLNYK